MGPPAQPQRPWGFSELRVEGVPVSLAGSPGCTLQPWRGKNLALGGHEEGKVCIHITISQSLLQTAPGTEKALCIGLLCPSPHSPPSPPPSRPGLRGAAHSCPSRKGLTGSAWRPAATEAHCSPAAASPSLIQEDPVGSPFKRSRPGVSRCLRAAGQRFGRPGSVGSGKGNSSQEGQGTAVTTKSQGLSE